MAYQTEIVVVGAGAAGFGAALSAVDAGKKVILLEKGNKTGGAGFFGAQGLFAVESRQQQATGEAYTLRDAYEEMMTYTHYRSNPAITKTVLAKSADTIDWLADHGLQTELVNSTQEAHQDRPKVYHQYIDKFGAEEKMLAEFKQKGGQLLTETAAVGLTKTDDHVSAVQIEHAGQRDEITCQAVIVADGGFIGNRELVTQALDIDYERLFSMGERKATGDGMQMLQSIGARIQVGGFENHAASVISKQNPKWHNQTIFTLTNLPFLWVNQTGQRFVNEDIVYDFALWGNIVYQQGGEYYFVLDQATVDNLRTQTLDWTDSFERTFKSLQHAPVTHQVGPFPTIEADLAEAVAQGAAWCADSLADLAQQLNFTPDFETGINAYNQAVANQEDEQFYKAPEFLRFKVAQGPFHAVRANSTSLGTIGGVDANARMQVLTPTGHPIIGAYVAGNSANGMYDTSYPTIEGISCAYAWNTGRIAAESAVQDIQ